MTPCRSVGIAIICGVSRQCILQIKDRDYPNFPGALSFFGGALEPNETPQSGLIRELREELEAEVAELLIRDLGFATEHLVKTNETCFDFTLFQREVSLSDFVQIAGATIYEGCGLGIVALDNLKSCQFAWGLESVAATLCDNFQK